jgi:hypothetical protein
MKHALAIGAAAVLVVLAGCGKKAENKISETLMEKAIEKQMGGNADVKITDDQVRITTADGEMTYSTGGNVKIPDTFPQDVLVYPGANVQQQITAGDGQMLLMTSKDAMTKVAAAYRTRMVDEGWKQEAFMESAGQTILSYTKPNRTAGVVISADDNGTQITLSISTKATTD